MTELKTPQKENKSIYYFSTWHDEIAYDVLNIFPHQVYKTNEKGLFYLLKSIIDFADDFVDSEDGCFIPIELDTNLDKVIKETREMAGYDYPEEFRPPKEEEKKKLAEELKPLITEESLAKSKHNNSYEEGKK